MPDLAYACTLAAHGIAVRVRSSSAAALAWLEEFTRPPFLRTDAPADATVRAAFDPARFEALLAQGGPGGPEVDCFTMDQGPKRLALWCREGGRDVLLDERARVLVAASEDARDVEIVAAADERGSRLTLMRVVRELATLRALRGGQVPLHGSAVARGDRVFAAIGPKRAGKTSFLVHALARPGTSFVTNDRLFVDVAPETPLASGMPTIVRLRAAMLALFPSLGERVRSLAYWTRGPLDLPPPAADARPPGAPDADDAQGLSPAQLCAALGAEALAEGPLGAILLPRVAPEVETFSLERLPPEEAASRILREGLVAGGACARYFAGPEGAPRPHADALLERLLALTSRVPIYACALGRRAYEGTALLDAVLAERRDAR